MNFSHFPDKIKLSINKTKKIFYRSNYTSDNCPIYTSELCNFTLTIPKPNVLIYRINGSWVLQKYSDDSFAVEMGKYGLPPQSHPFGHWSGGGQVYPKY